MDAIFMRKFRFFGLFGLGIVLATQAALVNTIYDRFYAVMPHILPGHDTTMFATIISFVSGTLAVTINLLDGVSKPRETGVGKRAGVGTSVVAFATIFMIAMATIREWGLPSVFLISGAGVAIIFSVIIFDDTEARRLELEARTAGVARANGGKQPV